MNKSTNGINKNNFNKLILIIATILIVIITTTFFLIFVQDKFKNTPENSDEVEDSLSTDEVSSYDDLVNNTTSNEKDTTDQEEDNEMFVSFEQENSSDYIEDSKEIENSDTSIEADISSDEENSVEISDEIVISEYLLPFSSERLLTEEDIIHFTKEELRIARNEIFARHGRMFKDEGLQAYFDSKSWYNGTIPAAEFSESMLTHLEIENVRFIKSYENAETN